MRPSVERLEGRDCPSAAASFSNGVLLIQGDDAGDSLSAQANAAGQVSVTERGQAVPIVSQTVAPTTANLSLVVEQSGSGSGNLLSVDKSLPGVKSVLDASRGSVNTVLPLNTGGSTEIGGLSYNLLFDSPGGKDFLLGNAHAHNLFDWEPGTGTDVVQGAGHRNVLFVEGNNGNKAENDSVAADGKGGFVYSRNNLVPFQISASGVQSLVVKPQGPAVAVATGNTFTAGNLTNTGLRDVSFVSAGGADTLDFSANRDKHVRFDVYDRGAPDVVILGAGKAVVHSDGYGFLA